MGCFLFVLLLVIVPFVLWGVTSLMVLVGVSAVGAVWAVLARIYHKFRPAPIVPFNPHVLPLVPPPPSWESEVRGKDELGKE